jgi:uncharacterized protein YaiE (UPF0345 family)
LSGTAATASFALTLGGTGSVGFATTGAFSATSGSASSRLTQIEQVYATTGSNSFRATQSITGSLTVTGQIVAQTLNVQQVTSSIVFSSGSNNFGNQLSNNQTFTGSVNITGSLALAGNITSNGTAVVLGSGTTNYLPKFTGASTVGNSLVYDNGTSVVIGTATPATNYILTLRTQSADYTKVLDWGTAAGGSWGNMTINISAPYQTILNSGAWQFNISGTQKMLLDTSGNLGLGVTPSAWATSNDVRAIQLKAGAFWNYSNFSTYFGLNYYWDGSVRRYIISDYASEYQQIDGQHRWFNAPSGTAGNAITFTQAMTLDASGNLGVGLATHSSKLEVFKAANNTLSRANAAMGIGDFAFGAGLLMQQRLSSPYGFMVQATNSSADTFYPLLLNPSGGNVGIGTSSPSSKLHAYAGASGISARTDLGGTIIAEGSTRAGLYILTAGTAAGSFGSIWWGNGNINTDAYITVLNDSRAMTFGTADAERMRITSGGRVQITTNGSYAAAQNGQLTINAGSGNSSIQLTNAQGSYCYLVNDGSYFIIGSDAGLTGNKVLISRNAPDNAMTITSGGDLYIGNSSISVGQSAIFLQKSGIITTVRAYSSGTINLVEFYRQGVDAIGTITYNGTSTLYNASSDYRLKEDLKNYNALEIVSKLKTYDFKWKNTDVRDYGMMAHELQKILPNYVSGERDDINEDGSIKSQMVDYSKLVPILTKAIQELKAELDELKNK